MTVEQPRTLSLSPRGQGTALRYVGGPLILFLLALGLSLFGILLRPPGLLSSFWTANAVLLAVLLHRPSLASSWGWLGCALGYLLADLLTGSTVDKSVLLTAANLAGIGVAFTLFQRCRADISLARPNSTTTLILIVGAASIAAGCVGAIANPMLYSGSSIDGFVFWAVTEFANYVAILPFALTAPGLLQKKLHHLHAEAPSKLASVMPLAAFVVSVASAAIVGGVGALAIPIPSLVWCALMYGVPLTSAISFIFAMWTFLATSVGISQVGFPLESHADLISLRLAVSLIALTPLAVASAVTAHHEALREASAARKAAEEAMSARALLLATMAHELRTPLNAIVGLASVMEMEPPGGLGKAEHHEFVSHIRQGGVHLSELVTDLLDTAKVEAGEMKLAMIETSSRKMVDQSLRLVAGLAMQSKVRLAVIGDVWPDVVADPRAIKQVMINVVSNAVKFSPSGSEVRVSAEGRADRLLITIKDSGAGISAADLERLGRPYQQAGANGGKAQGTGLGLMLSMHLIREHGGTLKLASELGQGTTVSFDLAIA